MAYAYRQIGGVAGWSVHHPVGVVMLTLAVVVLGLFAARGLKIDLLPHIIYPDVRVRVVDPGVPAAIMEDDVTRQLEEQLAITEDAIHIQSNTTEGRSNVDLSFAYGKDIDVALRDASTRLDRAKRFLPDTVDPPIIFKRDPSQWPVTEYVIASGLRDPVELRDWVDYSLSRWLVNLPGVAAVEVGGGLLREIQIIVDHDRLAGLGIDVLDIARALELENKDTAGGRLAMQGMEITGRTAGRFRSLDEIINLPLVVDSTGDARHSVLLGEVAQVLDTHEDERLKVRLGGLPGIKVSLQKQPQANTVAVVDAVQRQIDHLREQQLIPDDITVARVNDEARFIRQSLRNATTAAVGGGALAMIVVFVFLGSVRRTLVIGSAIPIAILVTVTLMAIAGLTFNTMTLGGLALGIGMLVDSTIVMLENIYRHQLSGKPSAEASTSAAGEVQSAIVASTSTNLAAVVPFLFIGGLVGLLFRELIFTISAAILASLIVALTLVPALAGRIPSRADGALRRGVDAVVARLQAGYAFLLRRILRVAWLVIPLFVAGMVGTMALATNPFQALASFLPSVDDGRVAIRMTADRGIDVAGMDRITRRVETIVGQQPEVSTLFTTVGGFIFGRTEHRSANRASIEIQLSPHHERELSTKAWIARVKQEIEAEQLAGVKIRLRERGIRGLYTGRGDDDVGFRVKGTDLQVLEATADRMVAALEGVSGLRNVRHSNEDVNRELSVKLDRDRASALGLNADDVGRAVRFALGGSDVTEFIERDRSIDVILRFNRAEIATPADLGNIVLFSKTDERKPVRLGEIAEIRIVPTPSSIRRDRQQRIVEVSASLTGEIDMREAILRAQDALAAVPLPSGYSLYEAGNLEALKAGDDLKLQLLGLAVFLVLVVMAVQYESIRNPLIIMFSVPFAVIGVGLGLELTATPITMPVWLGLIMLAGIVVNNAIVLVEYIEIERTRTADRLEAIVTAGRLRLRPILMTTLTTVFGMLPLAIGVGEGSEMLQPLAITLVSGLSFSILVSLLLVPAVYFHAAR